MSKFKQSPITPGHRGKLGGVIFSENQYGPYQALKLCPTIDRTDAQQNATGSTKTFIKSYSNDLKIEQYKAWRQLVQHFKKTDTSGNEYRLAPRDLYVSCNSNLKQIGLPMIFDAPANIPAQTFDSFTLETFVENGLMNLNLFFTPEIEKYTRILMFATPNQKNCINYFNHSWFRRIGYIDSAFKSGDSILSIYQSRFQYDAPANYQIALRLRPVSTISGIHSTEIQITASYEEKS